MNDFEKYLEDSEIVQLALLAATHRYFYDKCFDKNGRLKDDEETKKINAIYKELWCKHPDWRAKIREHVKRYIVADDTFVNHLHTFNKPKRNFSNLLLIHFAEIAQPKELD